MLRNRGEAAFSTAGQNTHAQPELVKRRAVCVACRAPAGGLSKLVSKRFGQEAGGEKPDRPWARSLADIGKDSEQREMEGWRHGWKGMEVPVPASREQGQCHSRGGRTEACLPLLSPLETFQRHPRFFLALLPRQPALAGAGKGGSSAPFASLMPGLWLDKAQCCFE